MTKKQYEEELNEIGCQDIYELKSCGGRIPDDCKFGSWIRRNDPIRFRVGFNEVNR